MITFIKEKAPKWKRYLMWLAPLYAIVCVGSTFAIFEYYFQSFATSKNLPPHLYSAVYSISKIAMVIGSISAEAVMSRISNKFVFLTGLIGSMIFDLCMGSLYWAPSGIIFFALSAVIMSFRLFMGAWFYVSLLATVVERYSAVMGIVVAISECLWGISFTVGVSLGGYLIDLWRISLPFYAFPAFALLSLPYFLIHGPLHKSLKGKKIAQEDLPQCATDVATDKNYLKLLLNVPFMVWLITILFNFVMMGFNGPTIEKYLHETFAFTPTDTGRLLMLQHICYAVGSPLVGMLWQKGFTDVIAVSAQFLITIAFLIQGPVSILPVEPNIVYVFIAQLCFGLGGAGQTVCGFSGALQTAIRAGYPDDLKTSGIVSSWGFVSFVLGAAITPLWASAIVTALGYRTGSLLVCALNGLWAIIVVITWLFKWRNCKKHAENTKI